MEPEPLHGHTVDTVQLQEDEEAEFLLVAISLLQGPRAVAQQRVKGFDEAVQLVEEGELTDVSAAFQTHSPVQDQVRHVGLAGDVTKLAGGAFD